MANKQEATTTNEKSSKPEKSLAEWEKQWMDAETKLKSLQKELKAQRKLKREAMRHIATAQMKDKLAKLEAAKK